MELSQSTWYKSIPMPAGWLVLDVILQAWLVTLSRRIKLLGCPHDEYVALCKYVYSMFSYSYSLKTLLVNSHIFYARICHHWQKLGPHAAHNEPWPSPRHPSHGVSTAIPLVPIAYPTVLGVCVYSAACVLFVLTRHVHSIKRHIHHLHRKVRHDCV